MFVNFLSTTGQFNNNGSLIELAKRFKTRYNISIFSIGVGSEINDNELAKIVSLPLNEHLFILQEYPNVYSMVSAIINNESGKMINIRLLRGHNWMLLAHRP